MDGPSGRHPAGGVGYAAGTQTTEPLSGSGIGEVVCANGVSVTRVAPTMTAMASAPARRCTPEITLPVDSLLDTTIARARMLRQVGWFPGPPWQHDSLLSGLEERTCPQLERSG